jgi:hypothetical protein
MSPPSCFSNFSHSKRRPTLCHLEQATCGHQVKCGMNALSALSPPRQPGAPHLAGFSRDVGYRSTSPQASFGCHNFVRVPLGLSVRGPNTMGEALHSILFIRTAAHWRELCVDAIAWEYFIGMISGWPRSSF